MALAFRFMRPDGAGREAAHGRRGELGEANALLADVCSRTAAGGPGAPCGPVRLAAVLTLHAEE